MRLIISLLFLLPVTSISKVMATFIAPDNAAIEYVGRFDFSNPKEPSFDWPSVYITTQFEGTSCKVVLSGKCRYDIFVDGTLTSTLTVEGVVDTFIVAKKLKNGLHTLRIAKRTETNQHACTLHGFILDSKCGLVKQQTATNRNIEFIGDSYTAGFGNEHTSRECALSQCDSILFMTTNANRAFGALIAHSFNAHYQINAYSGKGLVRNYNGIDPGNEFLSYYDKVLNSKVNTGGIDKLWKFSNWHPEVIVIGLGINDFLADPPYADSALFDSTYVAMCNFLRSKHPGVKLVCCATDVWSTHALVPRVKSIVEKQIKEGKRDIWYFEYATDNTALYGHPSVVDHAKIAREMQPLIAKITQWNFTPIEFN